MENRSWNWNPEVLQVSAEWAAPIVPVVKPDQSNRICGDFRLTVNQALETERYPLPKIEDILASLAGGERFTKLVEI